MTIGRFQDYASVAAAKQTDNQLDVFAIDKNGALNVAWVIGTGGWNGPQSL